MLDSKAEYDMGHREQMMGRSEELNKVSILEVGLHF